MAVSHDIKSPQIGVEVQYIRFTPGVAAGDAGVSNISGSSTGIRVWHLSASDASPYPGVFGVTVKEDHARLLGVFPSFTPSGTLEGTGSNGLQLPRTTVRAIAKADANVEASKTYYITLIQTSGSGEGMTRDHAHLGRGGRPVDVTGTIHDHVELTLIFQNKKDG